MTTTTQTQRPSGPTPFPLGRNVEHDSRSRMFPFITRAEVPIQRKSWLRYGKVLDQGNVGACTGFAAAHALNMKPNYVKGEGVRTNEHALRLYSAATTFDEFPGSYPGEDTGSSGNGVCKAMLAAGLITEYRWAFGFDQMLQALMHSPVMLGTWWHEGMFYPSPTGVVTVSGQRVGGHEYVVSGVASMSHRLLWLQNSWGRNWGLSGRALISFADVAALLANDGDCVIPVGGPWT